MTTFNFTYAPGTTLNQIIGFEVAGRIWSQFLSDPVTVNIHVQMTDSLPTNVIGGSLPKVVSQYKFKDFREKLAADAKSATDQQVQQLFNDNKFATWFDLFDPDGLVDKANRGRGGNSGISEGSDKLNLTSANAKALGVELNKKWAANGLDGLILMNSLAPQPSSASRWNRRQRTVTSTQPYTWNYDYSRQTAAPPNTLDFLSTALHEIGHVLGFVSSADQPGWIDPMIQDNKQRDNYKKLVKERVQGTNPLDLFRHSHESGELIDLSLGGDLFLSIDKGKTSLGTIGAGEDVALGGNGLQTSHWHGEGAPLGVMEAFLKLGQRLSLSHLDLQVFDAIGWDAASGAQHSLNLPSILTQAKQSLAQRLGVSLQWLDANPVLASGMLSNDRTVDLIAMLEESEIYKGRRNGGGGSWQEFWQELIDVFSQQGAFDTLGEDVGLQNVKGTQQRDALQGTTLDDVIRGLGGRDRIFGYTGNDQLQGNRHRDELIGGDGNDQLVGNRGRDRLMGEAGNDILRGGIGSDQLSGGTGEDVFVVESLAGLDIVQDFTVGEDKLKLSGNLQWEQLQLTQQGKHTLISTETQSLMLLHNVQASTLTIADIV